MSRKTKKYSIAEPVAEGDWKARVKPWEARSGGHRTDENNVEYYLTPSELQEFERHNVETEDDSAFWSWFRGFRLTKGIKAPTYKPSSWGSEWDKTSWGGDDYDDAQPKKKGWLSSKFGSWKPATSYSGGDWWQKDTRTGMGWATGNEQKLAIALRHVNATIRIIDENIPPMRVEWAEVGREPDAEGTSSTNFEGRVITINPAPITKGKLSDAEALEIETGFALHEAGHSTETRKVKDQLYQPEPLFPAVIVGTLANLLEDMRTEPLTAKDWPGFAYYFPLLKDYMWPMRPDDANPAEWHKPITLGKMSRAGRNKVLAEKLNAIIVNGKWHEKVRVTDWSTTTGKMPVLGDASFDVELPWWDAWLTSYLDGKTNLREAVQAGVTRLMEQDENLQAQAEAEAQQWKKDGEDAETFSKMFAEAVEELKKEGLVPSCDHGSPDERLGVGEGDHVRKLVEDDYHTVTIPKAQGDTRNREFFLDRPKEDAASRSSYVGKTSGIVARLKAALQFRPELPHWSDRLRRSGTLDEEELHRFASGDYRMFEQRIIETYPNAQVTMLVDMSGSMCDYGGRDSKLTTAQRLAQLFVEALRDMQGVTPKVYGHTGNIIGQEMVIHTIWEPGDPMTRLGLVTSKDHGENYDGYAIHWCVNELLERGGPSDQRLLVVLSDGYPAGSGYGGELGQNHVRAVTDDAIRRNVYVVQVAIDHTMSAERQSRMFKHWLPYSSDDALPSALAKLLSRILNQ